MEIFELELEQDQLKIGSVKVPYSQSVSLLKQCAAKGVFSFKGKPLIVDLFSKVMPEWEVDKSPEGKLLLKGHILLQNQCFSLEDLTFIAPSDPIWFIAGNRLKIFAEDVSWSLLQNLPRTITPKELEEFNKEGLVTVKFSGSFHKEPLPYLKLTDRGGAFANLFMDYGDKQYAIEDPLDKELRNYPAETSWEKDLIETGYQLKTVDRSRYYCPLDKVGKSLAFLLELGWKLFDSKGNRIVLETKRTLEAQLIHERIQVKGSLQFSEYEAPLDEIKGAFNRRESFIHLGEGVVGLLKDSQSFGELLEDSATISEGVQIPKKQLCSLLEQPSIAFSPDLNLLKNIGNEEVAPSNSFKGSLRSYQKIGLNFLETLCRTGFSAVLADEMGLGKTVQYLAFLSLKDPKKRHLIVAPASLLFNWENEFQRFLPQFPCARYINTLPENGAILISYHKLRENASRFHNVPFETVVLDEAHFIKNPDSKIAQAVCSLSASFRVSMTGTLIENHAKELWSQFHFLMPGFLEDRTTFESRLSLAEVDARYARKIKKQIRPFLLRRRKEEVAKDLPPLTEQTCLIEMPKEQTDAYETFLKEAKSGLLQKISLEGASKQRMEIFETILRLRQIACHPLLIGREAQSGKMEALLSDLETIADEGKKVLIFSQFTSMLNLIAKELKEQKIKYVRLDGSTLNREEPVKIFQEDPSITVFLLSLKAGGVGLNLTAADYVILFEPWWNEAAEAQAIGRAHRIGQTKPVIAKRYIAKDSIEEKMMSLKKAKLNLSEGLIDEEAESFSLDDLMDLLEL